MRNTKQLAHIRTMYYACNLILQATTDELKETDACVRKIKMMANNLLKELEKELKFVNQAIDNGKNLELQQDLFRSLDFLEKMIRIAFNTESEKIDGYNAILTAFEEGGLVEVDAEEFEKLKKV